MKHIIYTHMVDVKSLYAFVDMISDKCTTMQKDSQGSVTVAHAKFGVNVALHPASFPAHL